MAGSRIVVGHDARPRAGRADALASDGLTALDATFLELVPDPDFRLEDHVREVALPAPGGEAELLDWAGDYAFGARLEEVFPLVPLAADHALGVAVVSYDGNVYFGLNGDERSTRDLDVLVCGIEHALSELGELAATGHARATLG